MLGIYDLVIKATDSVFLCSRLSLIFKYNLNGKLIKNFYVINEQLKYLRYIFIYLSVFDGSLYTCAYAHIKPIINTNAVGSILI